MAMSLEVMGEVTVQTALRRVRKERREEGTWDRGDEREVYKRLPGNLWGAPLSFLTLGSTF